MVLYAKKIKTAAKHLGLQQMQTRWEEKALHGRYLSQIKEADVDTKAANKWLKSSGLKAETEGFMLLQFLQTGEMNVDMRYLDLSKYAV